jgi:hypothetical protein
MTQLSLLKPTAQSIPSADTLQAQLLAYEFPAAFAGRLAKEHGWTLAFAGDVLREYRRFLILAATSAQSVTPSQTVDHAWHEHLTHTRDYWERLTPLLPSALHHEPGEGAPGDAERFAAQYQDTLSLYRQRFGEPDSRIWPDPNRPAGRRNGSAQLWMLVGIAAVGLGIATLVKPWIGLTLIAALLILAYLATRPRRRRSGRSGRGSDGDGGDAGLFFLGFLGGSGSDAGASGNDSGGHSSGSDGSSSDGGSSCGSSCGGGCGS